MAGTAYPRRDFTIAPLVLGKILSEPLPDWARRDGRTMLVDLDESSWQTYSEEECRILAEKVIQTIGQVSNLEQDVLDTVVVSSEQPVNIPLPCQFSVRTTNCLGSAGFLDEDGIYAPIRISDLIAIPNFGLKCLLEVLTITETMESFGFDAKGADEAGAEILQELQREASALTKVDGVLDLKFCDPRNGRYISAIAASGVTLEDKLSRLNQASLVGARARRTLEAIRDLKKAVRSQKKLTFETEVDQILDSYGLPERTKTMVIEKTGIDGAGGKTLQEVGDYFGVTRERVRQIIDKALDRMEISGCYAPATDRAVALLAEIAPCFVEYADSALADAGITRGRANTKAVLATGSLFGRENDIEIDVFRGAEVLHRAEDKELLSAIFSTVVKESTIFGTMNCSEISAAVENETGITCSAEFTGQLLDKSQMPVTWYDEVGGWFWLDSSLDADEFGITRNRLINQIRKILSVTGRIDVSTLREGIRRFDRMKGFAPPKGVLLALASQLGFCTVEGENIIPSSGLDYRKLLRTGEIMMVNVLLGHGSIMTREQLESECVSRGLNRSSFYVYLGYSSVIEKYAEGVYGIRGAEIQPGYAASIAPRRKREKVQLDHGWTDDRRVWIGYRVSDSLLASGVFGIPAALKEIICPTETRYKLFSEDNTAINELTCRETIGWCLTPFFTRRGVESGDCITLVFDVVNLTVTAVVGEEAFTQFADEGSWSFHEGKSEVEFESEEVTGET